MQLCIQVYVWARGNETNITCLPARCTRVWLDFFAEKKFWSGWSSRKKQKIRPIANQYLFPALTSGSSPNALAHARAAQFLLIMSLSVSNTKSLEKKIINLIVGCEAAAALFWRFRVDPKLLRFLRYVCTFFVRLIPVVAYKECSWLLVTGAQSQYISLSATTAQQHRPTEDKWPTSTPTWNRTFRTSLLSRYCNENSAPI